MSVSKEIRPGQRRGIKLRMTAGTDATQHNQRLPTHTRPPKGGTTLKAFQAHHRFKSRLEVFTLQEEELAGSAYEQYAISLRYRAQLSHAWLVVHRASSTPKREEKKKDIPKLLPAKESQLVSQGERFKVKGHTSTRLGNVSKLTLHFDPLSYSPLPVHHRSSSLKCRRASHWGVSLSLSLRVRQTRACTPSDIRSSLHMNRRLLITDHLP